MAFSPADADALRAAIATGALRVRHADGREVQYRTLREIRETLDMIERDIAAGGPQRSRSFVAAG